MTRFERDAERAAERAAASGATRILRTLVLAPILVYRGLISPALPRRCRYEPTCSRYAVQAIGRYGILRGLVLAGWRLLRCNPWSLGGYDPVEAQSVFGTCAAGQERPVAGPPSAGPGHTHSNPTSPPC